MIGKKEKKNDEREKNQKKEKERVINQRNMGKQRICSQEEV